MAQDEEKVSWQVWFIPFAIILSIFTALQHNDPEVEKYPRKVSVEFLQHLKQRQYADAESLLSKDAQKEMNKDILRVKWEKMIQVHGEIDGWNVLSIGTSDPPAEVLFRYGVSGTKFSFSNGSVVITLDPEYGDGEGKLWKITEVIISP
jgi:hypothetical protein